jgi:hypothetical protein
MTVIAFAACCLAQSMEALFLFQIFVNFFMAITAHTALAFLVEWLVTALALFLVFRMTFNHLAWHYQ